MQELEQYYKILGLEVGASLDEVNQAYRDLAFIWHPDRLPKDNPRLLEKAVAKLKEINYAREQLRLNQKSNHNGYYQAYPSPKSTTSHTNHPPKSTASYGNHHDYKKTHHNGHRTYYASYVSVSEQPVQRPYHRDLSHTDFRGANLKEKDLSGRILIEADLSYADLSDSFLHKVNLEKANLFRANLFRANLLQANLRGANLEETNLVGADLSGADLTEANLKGAKIGAGNKIMVKLTGVILKGAILPDGTIHQ